MSSDSASSKIGNGWATAERWHKRAKLVLWAVGLVLLSGAFVGDQRYARKSDVEQMRRDLEIVKRDVSWIRDTMAGRTPPED